MSSWKPWVAPAALILSTSAPCFATTYLTLEQAQKLIFPNANLTPANVTLSPAQRKAIEKASDTRVRSAEVKAWRAPGGGWFIVDEVLGKHEFITYAVGLTANGAVTQIEVMEYRESYGSEVRNPKWRAQFTGKTAKATLKLDQDIENISGATLSSRHITEGVRRVLATYEAALK
ncbi:MAG: uncharacterized protein JWL59_420 [Chthoniobacteraceae bacterium]|nr:uncharacterized protein [Chthoniobacteraceae bacterium]